MKTIDRIAFLFLTLGTLIIFIALMIFFLINESTGIFLMIISAISLLITIILFKIANKIYPLS